MVNFYSIEYTDGYDTYNIAWFVSNKEYDSTKFSCIIDEVLSKIAISNEISDKPYSIYSIIFDYDEFNTMLWNKYGLKRLNVGDYPRVIFDERTKEFDVLEHELGKNSWCYDNYDFNIKHDEKQDDSNKLSAHYKINGLDPIGAFEQGLISKEEYIGFLKGNVIKYIARFEYKGQVLDDLHKAQDYLNILIRYMERLDETDI